MWKVVRTPITLHIGNRPIASVEISVINDAMITITKKQA